MSREDLVQQVADTIRREFVEDHEEVTANAVLDEILPQVTTVAELEALEPWSVLVSAKGLPFEGVMDVLRNVQKWRRNGEDYNSAEVIAHGPFTVVFQL